LRWLKQSSPFILASLILGILMVLFIVVPITGTFANSAPGLLSALTDFRTLNAIWLSFYCAFLATILILVLGVPFAYLFVRNEFPGKNVLDSLIDIPILIPHNAAGIALLTILGPSYPIGAVFASIGIRFVDTVWGIVLAMAYVSAPFLIRSAQEAFMSIDSSMEKSARSLGATRFRAFLHVTLPLSSRGILTGCLLAWARSVGEFGAVMLLAYYPQTAPVYLYNAFVTGGLNAALPIEGVLILLAVVILVVFKVIIAEPRKPVY
jgi:molybdate/tungstate transport system permease protein